MGHVQDHQDIRQGNSRDGVARQAFRRVCTALVGLGLAAALWAQVPSNAPARTPVAFDAAKSWAHLLKQCEFGPRVPNTAAHLKCREYILDEMKKYCEDAHPQEFSYKWAYGRQTLKMANLIGTQNWKDAKVRILLLAHWDSRPMADRDPIAANRNKPILGANDGASGVAVLLELMRVVKDRLPKDVGIMYFMTDGEDVGPDGEEMYLGVKEFVKQMPAQKPTYGILLDMIGDRNLEIPMEPGSLRYAGDLLRAFYKNAGQNGLASTFPAVIGPEIEDDHLPLNEAGIPTIDLIDFDFRQWHTVGDVPSTCSSESLKKVGTALETWVLLNPPYLMPKGG